MTEACAPIDLLDVEEGFEVIAAGDDEISGIVARNWPHLLAKLPSEEE